MENIPLLFLLLGFALLLFNKFLQNIVWACTVNKPMSPWRYADAKESGIYAIPRVAKKYSLVFGKHLFFFILFAIFDFVVILLFPRPSHSILALVFSILYLIVYLIYSYPQIIMMSNYREIEPDIRKLYKFDKFAIRLTNLFCLLNGAALLSLYF